MQDELALLQQQIQEEFGDHSLSFKVGQWDVADDALPFKSVVVSFLSEPQIAHTLRASGIASSPPGVASHHYLVRWWHARELIRLLSEENAKSGPISQLSLTHSGDFIWAATTSDVRIKGLGIDLEVACSTRKRQPSMQVQDRLCTISEKKLGLEFWDVWSIKEATYKAASKENKSVVWSYVVAESHQSKNGIRVSQVYLNEKKVARVWSLFSQDHSFAIALNY